LFFSSGGILFLELLDLLLGLTGSTHLSDVRIKTDRLDDHTGDEGIVSHGQAPCGFGRFA
jgi:hypothetical protein